MEMEMPPEVSVFTLCFGQVKHLTFQWTDPVYSHCPSPTSLPCQAPFCPKMFHDSYRVCDFFLMQ